MSVPYLAFELDDMKRADMVASAAGTHPGHIAWGLLKAGQHAFLTGKDTFSPIELAGFFGQGAPVDALVAFDFFKPVEGGLLLCKAERYHAVKRAQSEGGKSKVGNLKQNRVPAETDRVPGKTDSSPPAPHRVDPAEVTGSTPGLTPSTEHRAPLEALKPPPAKAAGATAKAKPAPKAPDARHAPLVAALVALFEADGHGAYAFDGRDAKAVSDLLAKGTPAEVEARWRRALRHEGFPLVRTLPELKANWNHFATDTPAKRKGRATGSDTDWSTPHPTHETEFGTELVL